MIPHTDEYWMQRALDLALHAEAVGEVPVGAVLVLDNEMIGAGWNQPIHLHDPTAHAEIQALRAGALHLKNYRLLHTTLYVTLGPCMMCVGAMVHARIQRLVVGALDSKTSIVGSAFAYLSEAHLNHKISCEAGILQEACSERLKAFFRKRR